MPPWLATEAERYDAASKAIAAGVPWRTVMASVLMFGPQAIARMEAERAALPAVGADAPGLAV